MSRSLCFFLVIIPAMGVLMGCKDQAKSGPEAAPEPSVRQVQIEKASLRPLPRVLSVTGTLTSRERAVLSAKVSGRLATISADIGTWVKKGDALAQVERRDYELRLDQAAATLAQARAALGLPTTGGPDEVNLEDVTLVRQTRAIFEEAKKNRDRVRRLSQAGIASQSELDTVESTFAVAEARHETALEEARTRLAALAGYRAAYDLARKQLADAVLIAPFDGVIQRRSANLGEYVAPGTPIVELVQVDPLRLRMDVPERSAASVRLQQEVRFRVEGDPVTYRGHIARISPALEEENRTLLVEADIPASGNLRPGLFVRAEIVLDPKAEGLMVPPSAVVVFAGLEKVFTVSDGKAVERLIRTGQRGTNWVEILAGLKAGEGVVIDPSGLRAGQLVRSPARLDSTPAPSNS